MSAEDFTAGGMLQLEVMHLAAGKALMDGLAAAHLRVHAVSPQPQARAQVCALAQLGTAMHSSIWLAHLSKEQVHASWQVALLQSMSAEDFTAGGMLQLELMHLAAGKALMDGLAAAHLRVHAVSPQPQARAQVCALAQLGTAMHSSISLAHLSNEQVHASWQVALLQSMSAAEDNFVELHSELMHLAAGRALMDGLLAAHFKMHASSLHGHAKAQVWALAQLSTAKQAS